MTEPKPSNQQKLAKNTIMVHPTRKNHHNQNSSYLHSQPHKHTHKKGIQAQAAGTHKQQTPQHNHHTNSGSINMPWRMKKHLKKVHWHTIEFSNNTTTTTKLHKTVQPAAVATPINLHTPHQTHKPPGQRRKITDTVPNK
ncbi:hypothetical protein, partial [Corynebacterium argentoratense]|uniref:hypothetical protein n=1 Tax=Corynebacterium argentoratense TaxID=42817 RepID=UPI001F1B7A13